MFDDFRGFPRAVYVVAVGQFINLFGSGVVYPFSTLYFYGEVGIPLTLVGTGLLANNVATAVGTAAGGYLADRFGRKPVMAASMALSFPTLAGYALVRTAPEFVVDGATCGAVAVLLWVALPRSHDGDRAASFGEAVGDWSRAVTHPTVLWLAVLNVGFAVAYAQMQSTVPVFAKSALGLSSEQLGTLYVLNPLVIVLFQMPVVARVRRWRRTRGLLLSTGFWAASFVAVIVAHRTPRLLGIALVGAFLVLRTVGELLHSPVVTALASDVSGSEARGSKLSVVEVAKRLGFGAGSVVGGAFFDAGAEGLLWSALIGMCGAFALGTLALETRVSPSANGRAVAEN